MEDQKICSICHKMWMLFTEVNFLNQSFSKKSICLTGRWKTKNHVIAEANLSTFSETYPLFFMAERWCVIRPFSYLSVSWWWTTGSGQSVGHTALFLLPTVICSNCVALCCSSRATVRGSPHYPDSPSLIRLTSSHGRLLLLPSPPWI